MSRAFLAVVIALAPLVLASVPAEAAGPAGYQITVSETAPTMTFGEPETSPSFQASLTVPAGDSGVGDTTFYVLIDSQRYFGSITVSGSTFQLFVRSPCCAPPLPAGPHSVVAQYNSPVAGLVTSNPITLTIQKTTPVLSCGIGPFQTTYLPATAITVDVQFSTPPVDPSQGTFTLTFAGTHQTFVTSGLVAVPDQDPVVSGIGHFAASVPAAPDVYMVTCTYSGTANVASVDARPGTPKLIVSRNNTIGGIQVHTDPSPVRDGVTITWNVVVLGAPGLPAPTGFISVRLGGQFTPIIALTGGGSVTFQTNPATGLTVAGGMRINYFGDPEYASSFAEFPLTGSPPTPLPAPSPASAATPASVSLSAIAPPATGQGPAHTPMPASGTEAAARLAATRAPVTSGALALGTLIAVGVVLALRRRRRAAGAP